VSNAGPTEAELGRAREAEFILCDYTISVAFYATTPFKLETGMTPAQHLKSLRIQKAKELLEGTFLNVKQIMMEVGINDESHFVRDFNERYGLPPTEYRRNFRNT
jgi:AraC-like DNA-binding protein